MSAFNEVSESLYATSISGPSTFRILGWIGFPLIERGSSDTDSCLNDVDHLMECPSLKWGSMLGSKEVFSSYLGSLRCSLSGKLCIRNHEESILNLSIDVSHLCLGDKLTEGPARPKSILETLLREASALVLWAILTGPYPSLRSSSSFRWSWKNGSLSIRLSEMKRRGTGLSWLVFLGSGRGVCVEAIFNLH